MAQAQDASVFDNYENYSSYVDAKLMNCDFVYPIQRLGGRDEYTPENLASNESYLKEAWPCDLTGTSVFRLVNLGAG